MSFGGTVSSMITSLKNNARHRKTLYDKKFIFHKAGKNKLVFPNVKASPEQLDKIRKEAQKENHIIVIKRITALLILLLLIAAVVWLVLSNARFF